MNCMRVATLLQSVAKCACFCAGIHTHMHARHKAYTKAQPVGQEIQMHNTAYHAACARLVFERDVRVCMLTLCIVHAVT